ncbi:carbohydrate ABC transporter permease [Jiangella asiatica]|uniref:Carbohydrate ABC transporter permease n=1 Tax=Jiangella asiatica TaxID=2530372 RepID=A0A4R5CNM0_9ACTN|nr:carbohydrate ABC transporter permease [Jiangella asiatica]TDD99983.1 carbohydrate ABC transporter permease [Jiangella asiatica]
MPSDTAAIPRQAPSATPAPSARRRRSWRRRKASTLLVVVGVITILTVFPLVWMVTSSFKGADEVLSTDLLPSAPTVDNFEYVFSAAPFGRYLLNSFIVSVTVTVVALFFHSMAAYALARLRFPGRDAIFMGIFSTLLVTAPVVLVPLFLVVHRLGLLNSYAGLILPAIFSAFGIFLLRQFYLAIPAELEEAAVLDGCGYWRIYWSIIVPLSRSIFAALAVLFFLANWNAFLWPLVATTDTDLQVVQLGIVSFQDQNTTDWQYVLAAATVAAVPTLLAFAIFQRRIVESIKTSGLK